MTAISGDFVTVQHVPTRKCWKLTIEVDEANIAQVFQVLGYPTSGESISVGIARLTHAPNAEKPKRHFNDMQPSQQAGMLCCNEEFQQFIWKAHTPLWSALDVGEKYDVSERRSRTATAVVRSLLSVESRSELDSDEHKAKLWSELLGSFEAWKRGVAA